MKLTDVNRKLALQVCAQGKRQKYVHPFTYLFCIRACGAFRLDG
jgi:hypothetical protein